MRIIHVVTLVGILAIVGQAGATESRPIPEPMHEKIQAPRSVLAARSALLQAHQLAESGDDEAAHEEVARAIALDPWSPTGYLTWAQYAESPQDAFPSTLTGLRNMVRGFPNQLTLFLNTYLIILWSIVLGVVATAGAVVVRHIRHVHHSMFESLRLHVGKSAAFLAAVLLLLPLLWGGGLIPTLLFFLLWFWPILRTREQRLTYGLGVAGALLWVTHVLAPGPLAPLGEQHGPLRTAVAFETGGTTGYTDDLDMEEPAGYVEWARGMVAKRRGDLITAERELTAAAEVLPDRYEIHNDLGNVQFLQGKIDEARESYLMAKSLDEDAAEPYFNLAQVLTEKLELIEADISLQQALQLDYPVISAFNHSAAGEAETPAIDALPDGRPFWVATLIGRNVGGRLDVPGGLRVLAPGGRMILMPLGVLLLGGLGLVAGQWLRNSVRTFSCSSCGKIVCRRCLIRVESRPYCQDCGRTLSADCSAEYSRALLKRYFQRRLTARGIVTEVVRRLLPGWTEVSDWALKRSVVVLSLSSAALLLVSMRSIPVIPPPVDVPIPPVSAGYWWSAALLIYVVAHAMAWRWRASGDDEYELEDEDEPGLRVMGE